MRQYVQGTHLLPIRKASSLTIFKNIKKDVDDGWFYVFVLNSGMF